MVRDLVDSPCGFVLTYGRSTVSLYISHFSLRLFEVVLVSNVRHPILERVSNEAMILDSIAKFTTRGLNMALRQLAAFRLSSVNTSIPRNFHGVSALM